MNEQSSLDELKHSAGSNDVSRNWYSYLNWNSQMHYTEGVRDLADKTESYWLIYEIKFVILPRLIKENKDRFYCIELLVISARSAVIIISDSDGNNIHLKHHIHWTDFLVVEKTVKFYLCDAESDYCLMLPSEY